MAIHCTVLVSESAKQECLIADGACKMWTVVVVCDWRGICFNWFWWKYKKSVGCDTDSRL